MWPYSSVVSFSSHKSPSFRSIVRNNLWSGMEEDGRVHGRGERRQFSASLTAFSMQQKYPSCHLGCLIRVVVFWRVSETLNSAGRWTKPGPTPVPYIIDKKSNRFPHPLLLLVGSESYFSWEFLIRVLDFQCFWWNCLAPTTMNKY